eukprot:3615140-Rhodomonas_salina.1
MQHDVDDDLPCMNMEVAGGNWPGFPRKKVAEEISTRSRSAIFEKVAGFRLGVVVRRDCLGWPGRNVVSFFMCCRRHPDWLDSLVNFTNQSEKLRFRGRGSPEFFFRINDTKLPSLKPHQTYKYLGVEIALNGSWAAKKARVKSKLCECVAALKGSPYLQHQLEQIVLACLLPIFRYGAGLVDWSAADLDGIAATFCNARQLAWKLPPGSPRLLHTLSTQHGEGQMPHAKLLWAKEMLSMWAACRAHKDTLASMVEWEW